VLLASSLPNGEPVYFLLPSIINTQAKKKLTDQAKKAAIRLLYKHWRGKLLA
jgi:hypothetical protein